MIRNTTEPCSQCGVPACGRENIPWYEEQGYRLAYIFDDGYFDLALGEYFSHFIHPKNYADLPRFMRDWNELKGWEDSDEIYGFDLEIDDFITAVRLLKKCKEGRWVKRDELDELIAMAKYAKIKHLRLKMIRG
jgi:hypothetical protein